MFWKPSQSRANQDGGTPNCPSSKDSLCYHPCVEFEAHCDICLWQRRIFSLIFLWELKYQQSTRLLCKEALWASGEADLVSLGVDLQGSGWSISGHKHPCSPFPQGGKSTQLLPAVFCPIWRFFLRISYNKTTEYVCLHVQKRPIIILILVLM